MAELARGLDSESEDADNEARGEAGVNRAGDDSRRAGIPRFQ